MKRKENNDLVIYQTPDGSIELRGDYSHETVWATQLQIAVAFGVDVRTVNEHIGTIYSTQELRKSSTIRKFRIVQKEGQRNIQRSVQHYNLDMILSVGYRVNSKRATKFRKWATKTLREHILIGYTINRKRITKNFTSFMKTVNDIQNLLPEKTLVRPKDVIELIREFADTWVSLDAYDRGAFSQNDLTKKHVDCTAQDLSNAISALRRTLLKKGETSGMFATERQRGGVENIIGNIMQSFDGRDVYVSVEEKAAHLLYFIVKNHPFVDGNKRTGAFAFVWFLQRAATKSARKMNPSGLTALTLLTAESRPAQKEKIISLIIQLLG